MSEKGRPFAAFDIDGTLIRWQLYHAVVDALIKLEYVSAKDFEAIKQARMDWKKRSAGASFKSYERELVRAYEATLLNLSPAELDSAVEAVFGEYRDQVYVYTRNLIDELKKKNYLLFAISGSQSEIVAKVASYYGFDAYVGTDYEQIDNKFTGKKVFHAHNKALVLNKLIKQFKARSKDSYAVGDSMGDVAMLGLADNAVAFNPEKELFNHAKRKGWTVVLERKNVIYELEANGSSYLLAKAS